MVNKTLTTAFYTCTELKGNVNYGKNTSSRIRLTDKTTPIIFMSAKDDKPSKLYEYKIGVDDYITKPFDIDILMMKITATYEEKKPTKVDELKKLDRKIKRPANEILDA